MSTSNTLIHGVAPEKLSSLPGAPSGWDWRKQQREITQRILDSDKKVIILQAEPGSGKTTIAWATLSVNPMQRSVILVQTRQLEEQYLRDFSQLRMIQGRRWYSCRLGTEESGHRIDADEGPCTIGYRCEYAGIKDGTGYVVMPACDYFAAKLEAVRAPISIHNYSYWLSETRYNPRTSFTNVDWIVCDEAHDLQSILMDAGVITFDRAYLRELGVQPIPRGGLAELRQWARDNMGIVQEAHDNIKRQATARGLITDDMTELEEPTDFDGAQGWTDATSIESRQIIKQLRRLANLLKDLGTIAYIIQESEYDEWIIDRTNQAYLRVCPLYGKLEFRRIMASANRVVLMSAYLAPELLVDNLGLAPDEYEIIEADEIYNRRRSKIYYCGTTKMSYKTSDAMWRHVTGCIDSFIEYYAPASGFIHVPSVALRNRIRNRSKHQNVLITYDGDNDPSRAVGANNKAAALTEFKNGQGQRVLLGQSTATGIDVPYVPQFNIIVKVAFPPTKDPVVAARMKRDKSYYPFLTICQIVQAAGRAKRASDHHCETIILDKQFGWFYAANKQHFPKWFNRSLQRDGWKKFPSVRLSMKRKGVIL